MINKGIFFDNKDERVASICERFSDPEDGILYLKYSSIEPF